MKKIPISLVNRFSQTAALYLVSSIPLFFYLYDGFSKYTYPPGWDTPWHMYMINLFRQGEFEIFLKESFYQNFMYYVITSLIPMTTETLVVVFPSLIIVLMPWVLYKLIKSTSDYTPTLVFLSYPLWFTVYRLVPSLQPNLMGLLLSIIMSTLILSPYRLSSFLNKFYIFAINILAFFVHAETYFYFSGIILISFILSKLIKKGKDFDSGKIRILIISLAFTFPVFLFSKYVRLQYQGTLALINQNLIPMDYVFLSLGYYIYPLTIFGILYLFYKIFLSKSFSVFDIYVFSWSFVTFLLFLLHFFVPIYIYSFRALILFPVSLVLIPCYQLILNVYRVHTPKTKGKIITLCIVSLILFPSIYTYYENVSFNQQYIFKVFVNEKFIDLLYKIKEQFPNSSRLLFIYNKGAPGWIELNDNWVSAIIGYHLSYYGPLTKLLVLQNGLSNLISVRMYKKLIEDVNSIENLASYLIVMTNFTYQYDKSNYPTSWIKSHLDDALILDPSSILISRSAYFGILDFELTNGDDWWFNPSLKVLASYKETSHPPPNLKVFLYVKNSNYYNITLEYFDGFKGAGFAIQIGNTKFNVEYTGSNTFKKFSFTVFLNEGKNLMDIVLFSSEKYYFARFKSIEIEPNPFKKQL